MLEQLILNILACSGSMTDVPVPLFSADPKKLSGLGKSDKGDFFLSQWKFPTKCYNWMLEHYKQHKNLFKSLN